MGCFTTDRTGEQLQQCAEPLTEGSAASLVPWPGSARCILQTELEGRQVTAAVLVDRAGRALRFHGEIARFFELHGEATLELARMVHPQLRKATRVVLNNAAKTGPTARYRVGWPTLGAPSMRPYVDVQAARVLQHKALGMLVLTFNLTAEEGRIGPRDIEPAIGEVGAEHPMGYQAVSCALDEATCAEQQLRNAGAGCAALCERAQATNEELRNGQEADQVLCEQLRTVNAQLVDALAHAANDVCQLTRLLDSPYTATLLLDHALRVRRVTPLARILLRSASRMRGHF